MSGTKAGGRKAALANLKRNPNFYRDIGRKGGSVSGTSGGFASNLVGEDGLTGRERAAEAGRRGGTISRRKAKGV